MPLRKIVTEKKVSESLNRLPDAQSPVMDEFYPASIRLNHPSAYIRIDEIVAVTKAVPVVLRGTMPVSIGTGAGEVNQIEPQPIDVIQTISGKELNDIKNFDGTTEKAWMDSKTKYGRDTIRVTAEAIAIQSLTGTIDFPMKTEDGMDTYTVKFGNILSYTPTKKLNASGAGVDTVIDILNGMLEKLETAGSVGPTTFKASKDVYSYLVKLLKGEGTDTAVRVKIGLGKITIDDDIMIERFAHRYYDPKTKTWKEGQKAKTLKAIVKNSFSFRYLALDDIDAKLKPLPFFMKPIKRDIPSGWILNAMSKPLPIPDPNGICEATVL